jgi:hypothetical protein
MSGFGTRVGWGRGLRGLALLGPLRGAGFVSPTAAAGEEYDRSHRYVFTPHPSRR